MGRKYAVMLRHAEVLAIVATATLVTILEVVLLNVKYDAFQGGFLQSHQIKTLADRTIFLTAAAGLHVFAFGFLGISWFSIARAIRIRRALRVFDWIFWSLLLSGFISAVRYQIHSYFGDFLTFTIAKNLGGGSVSEALRYVTNEATLFLAAPVIVIGAYGFARRRVSQVAHRADLKFVVDARALRATVVCFLAVLLIAVLVGRNENMWYHMRRTNIHYALDRTLNWATDFDADGYGVVGFPKDSAPFNASIYPGALDRPGNGIDEDGLMGDFTYIERSPVKARPSGTSHPNIVLIVLESLRADALRGKASNGRPAMPFLSHLAEEGSSSSNYFSHTGYTTSSIKSIFSGSVGESAPAFLAPTLSEAGFQIHVVSGQDEHFGDIAEATGLDKFATTYFDAKNAPDRRVFASSAAGSLTLSNEDITAQFAAAMERADWKRPQFFYVNLQAAHFPYFHSKMRKRLTESVLTRGEIRQDRSAALWETYLNACADDDAAIEAIATRLRTSGQWERTLLVVIGDHGESLFDDGFLGHGFIISRTQLNTIFVSNRKFATPPVFGHADLAPLLLRQSGFSVEQSRRQPERVFHYIGSLDRPSRIGMTSPDGSTLAFEPASGRIAIYTSDGGNPFTTTANRHDEYSAHADLLRDTVLEWEHLRWESHLRVQPRGQ